MGGEQTQITHNPDAKNSHLAEKCFYWVGLRLNNTIETRPAM